MQRPEVGHQCRHLGRVQVVTVRRHLAAPLEHLPDQLIPGQMHGDVVERGSSIASSPAEGMAVPTLLVLKHQGALELERRSLFQQQWFGLESACSFMHLSVISVPLRRT